METKFTKGPWHVWYTVSTFEHRIRASSKVGICTTVEWASGNEEESLANANLIAQAPRMYKELKEAADGMAAILEEYRTAMRPVWIKSIEEDVIRFNEALALARGES